MTIIEPSHSVDDPAANGASSNGAAVAPQPSAASLAFAALPLTELAERAAAVRDQTFGTRVTYSPKVFIPLTMLCRDKCGYCTFAQPPARLDTPYLTPE